MKKIKHVFTETGEVRGEQHEELGNWVIKCIGNSHKIFSYERIEEDWKPKEGEYFWSITTYGELYRTLWYADTDMKRYTFGNCFPTKELAEEKLKQIKDILKGVTQ